MAMYFHRFINISFVRKVYFAGDSIIVRNKSKLNSTNTHSHKNDIKLYICIITDLYIFHILYAMWWILLEGPRFRNKIDNYKRGCTLFVALISYDEKIPLSSKHNP